MNAPADEKPLPLAVSIVCRNSERTILRTLESVAGLADQIVAIDSGSTDGTIGMLRDHGAEVIEREWMGYVRTKQAALVACDRPWILCLDSDESLEPELRRSVRATVERDEPQFAGWELNRKIWWAGGFLEYAWQPEWRLRLVRRGRAKWGGYDPHDALEIVPGEDGGGGDRVGRLRGDLRHDSFETMSEHLSRQVSHSRLAAKSYVEMGRTASVSKLITSPVGAWLKQMVGRQAWRDGWRGWSAASATAAATLMKHLILLEETRSASAKRDDAGEGDDA
ncbi:MAG: glycosyltransferase family 2 protein [Phycisphaeraceae bacterium]|nr:MAG: glycosyltransferase family 2 protein [Phycisphaeraceae bacterium]